VGGLRGFVAYTYARQRLSESYGDASAPIVYERDDADESRHGVRLASTFAPCRWASLGLVHLYDSGRPYPAAPQAGNGGMSATRGTNPGRDINDPADDVTPPRLASNQRLDFQARVRAGAFLPVAADFYLDVLNAFNAMDFEGPRPQAAAGRWVRFGAELRY
jgi:hypothetical protein